MTESHVLHRPGSDGRALLYLSRIHRDDLDVVREALQHLSPSHGTDHNPDYEKQHLVCMREVLSTGQNSLIDISLKQLLIYVNSTAANIDARAKESLDDKSFSDYQSKRHAIKHAPLATEDTGNGHTDGQMHNGAATHLLGRDLRRLDFESHPTEEPSVRVRRYRMKLLIIW